jgi:hypothetical protein
MTRAGRLALACAALALVAEAQPRASLSGGVCDPSGSPIPGAAVTAWNQESGLRRTTLTGGDGRYRIESLLAGTYKVAIRRSGFQTQVRIDFPLQANSGTLDFVLQVGSVHEVVTIRGDAPILNASDASLAVSVDRGVAEALPLNGRGVLSLIELAPGVVTTPATLGEAGQFSVSGQRQNANSFEVDGLNANNGVGGGGLPAQFSGGTLPMLTAFGSMHAMASLDEVEDVRIETSSFAPEYGRMPGGRISLTTRSGTAQFHGGVSGALRNASFDANDWFSNSRGLTRPVSRLGDWGATFAGPLPGNRSFFFAAYEGLRLDAPYSWESVVPSLADRAQAPAALQPLLAAFPLPNLGAALSAGVYTRPGSLESGTLRLDHALTSQSSLFFRLRQSPSTADSGYAEVDRSRFSAGSFTLGVTVFPNAFLANDARLGVSRVAVSSVWNFSGAGGAQPADLAASFGNPLASSTNYGAAVYAFGIGGIGAIYAGVSSPSRQGQTQLADTLSWNRAEHAVRVGVAYERLTPARDNTATGVSGTFWSIAGLLSGQPLLLNVSQTGQAASLIENLSAFAQDTWRVHPKLTITYGVRWELTPSPATRAGFVSQIPSGSSEGGVTSPPVPPSGTDPTAPPGLAPAGPPSATPSYSLWPTRYTQLAPRLGVAYRLSPETVVRGGWGVFHDVSFSVATDPVNGFPYNRWQFSSPVAGGGGSPVLTAERGISYAPSLRLPYTEEWNLAAERVFTRIGTLAASYVGSHGVHALRREGRAIPGTRLIDDAVATNNGSSLYGAFDLRFQRAYSNGISSLVAYTYSHSIDNGSWDNAVYFTQGPWSAASDRASSSFDVRHNLVASLAWKCKNWSLATIGRARSGFPIDVLSGENLLGLSFDDAPRPDRVPGAPIWIASAAGGRALNPAAFSAPAGVLQGNLGRNSIAGFGFYQVDLAVSRDFPFRERCRLSLRADAYNTLNHPMPGDPVPYLDSPQFGTSIAGLNDVLGMGSPHSGLAPSLQMGSPRTLQFSARLSF